nr:L,D-transpeptidase [Actinomycetota bacterium]
ALERGLRPAVRSRVGTVIEIDKTRQLIVVVREGQPVWTFHTSTGNNKPYSSGGLRAVAVTPEGQFRITHAINGMRVSELGELWRPRYFTGGYAIHGSPSIPPHPASHGCARLANAAIDFVWSANLMPIGTPVWVYS